MRNRILIAVSIAIAASVAVLAAQHMSPHQAPAHASRPDHAVCAMHHAMGASAMAGPHGATAGQHHAAAAGETNHAAALASALKLSEQQTADVERLVTEACAAMAKYHEQILAVLTPEQRAKLQEMHGGGEQQSSFIHEFFKKLHGGR